MNNVNENIFATPKVFLFSFFKPKTYARTILETKGKISKVNIAITLIAWFIFLPLLYIYQLKGLNISFQLLIIAYIMYASVTITLLTYIFSQESFVNNELEKLIAEGKIESDYWHKSVGFFQICFVLLNPIVIAIFIGDNAEGKTASETEKELYGSCTLEGLFERVDISTMKRVPWYIKEISTMKSVGNQQ